jgi:hypothetical protein
MMMMLMPPPLPRQPSDRPLEGPLFGAVTVSKRFLKSVRAEWTPTEVEQVRTFHIR